MVVKYDKSETSIDDKPKKKKSEDSVEERPKKKNRHCRRLSIFLQVLTFSANGLLWACSLAGVICGLVIGSQTRTIRFNDPNYRDITTSTPATTLFIHGLLLVPVTIAGCYSSVKSRIILSVIYVILIILYIVYDIVSGFRFFFLLNPFDRFYEIANKSMNDYDAPEKSKTQTHVRVGLFRVHANQYWDHLQRRAECCGLKSYKDWKNKTISTDQKSGSVPSTCCNQDYDYPNCGSHLFRHPDIIGHTKSDLVYHLGCIDVFPECLRPGTGLTIPIFANVVVALLLLCALLTIVLLLLVIFKCFDPDEGLNILGVDEKDSDLDLEKDKKDAKKGDPEDDKSSPPGKNDPRRMSEGDAPDLQRVPSQRSKQRIKFHEAGPQFIPSDRSTTSLAEDRLQRKNVPPGPRSQTAR